MRVLIVYANRYRLLAAPPVGAALVAARLQRDGHEVRLLDLMFAASATRAVATAVRGFRPEVVAFSLRNVDNQSVADFYDPLPVTRAIVAAAREAMPAGAVTLLGGTAFTTFPERYLDELDADFGLCGDDLEPISRFVASLAAGQPDLATPGLVYREANGAGRRIVANPYTIKGYAGLPLDGWHLLDLRPYCRTLATYWDAGVVLARTGCPFGCVFCDTYRTFGREWVLRDPALVVEEIRLQKRLHGVRSLFLADAGFNRPLDHAKAVLEAIVKADLGVDLYGIYEPGEMDAEFAHLFRRAGGLLLMAFVSSLSEPVVAALNKPAQVGEALAELAVLHRAGVGIGLSLMLGGPGETPETVEETLARAARVPALFTWAEHGFRVLPATPLHDIAVAEGVVAADADLFRPVFYHSPATPPAMLAQRLRSVNTNPTCGPRIAAGMLARYALGKLAAWTR